MSKKRPFFNLSLRFQNSHFIAFCALIAAVSLYSLLYLVIPLTSYYSGLLMAVIISLIVGYSLGHLVMAFNKEMKRQAEINKSHNKVKSQLIYILSHDVKGPLNNINRLLKLVREKSVSPEEVKEICAQLQEDTDNTLALTQNIVRWIKVQKDDYKPKIEKHNVINLIEETQNLYFSSAKNKGVGVSLTTPTQKQIKTDGEMYKIVLRNLLSNAIKYSSVGGDISVGYKFSKKKHITWVKDEGMGISGDRLVEIFSNETIESVPGTNNEKGTGLGLQLSRNIIKMLKGEIWAESKPGEGSCFYFSLPANHQPQSAK